MLKFKRFTVNTVLERRNGGWLALKPVKRKRILFRLGRQKLECDMAPQIEVLSLVNDAHPAAAQLRYDTVMRDGLADHCENCSWARAIHVRSVDSASQTASSVLYDGPGRQVHCYLAE